MIVQKISGIKLYRQPLPYGWTKLYRYYHCDIVVVCRWWAYPLLRPYYRWVESDWTPKRLCYLLGFLDTPEFERFEWQHFTVRGSAERRARNFAAMRAYRALKPTFQK